MADHSNKVGVFKAIVESVRVRTDAVFNAIYDENNDDQTLGSLPEYRELQHAALLLARFVLENESLIVVNEQIEPVQPIYASVANRASNFDEYVATGKAPVFKEGDRVIYKVDGKQVGGYVASLYPGTVMGTRTYRVVADDTELVSQLPEDDLRFEIPF